MMQDGKSNIMAMNVQLELANQSFDAVVLQEELGQNSEVTHLRLHLNFRSSILREISMYSHHLEKLRFLNLGYNNISNLQPLQHLCLNQLQQLHLFSNNISSTRALKKCSMSSLKFISLANNNLPTLQTLSEWNCPQLEQLVAYDNQIEHIPNLLRANFDGLRSICFGDQVDQNLLFIGCMLARFKDYDNQDQIDLLSDSASSAD